MWPQRSDRQAWDDELRELRAVLAHLRYELAATPDANRELQNMLAVKIKLVERRAANLRARLASPPDA